MSLGLRPRYCIVGDDDGHHFVIPANRLDEWFAYLVAVYAESNDDPPDEPEWAHAIGGAPSHVTFELPEIEGRRI